MHLGEAGRVSVTEWGHEGMIAQISCTLIPSRICVNRYDGNGAAGRYPDGCVRLRRGVNIALGEADPPFPVTRG